ncbi:CPBP family intramembrane metalloprotease [Pseudomaricurvus alkylphenolicus]|uniref:CPBP family intramembrane glutamic endopeptidase n=1 Tax=Pseudomaricurvus alkylphenolicus TaxID=1306991 RepID=UPI001421ED1E|nr:CPBP family intramembrane glutamic endopeptidase [Pseudomaricurvus alkylphenolicus]NIB38481.1 CPBP family intramembrane metalloprotease [Pseudomaricurvus alkylphenolicus]
MTSATNSQPPIDPGSECNPSTLPLSESQYSLRKILGIWAVVSLPMPILAFVVAPVISPDTNLNPAIVFWLLMIAGMAWQFVVALWVMYDELGTLSWSSIKKRTWLNMPRDPLTGDANAKLFWWLVPAIAFNGLVMLTLSGPLISLVDNLFPFIPEPTSIEELKSTEFVGAWWLIPLVLVSHAFNYFLGEEFLFRGVLLPKLQGVFGKWDWVAGAVLFASYHLHKPLSILLNTVVSLAGFWTSRRFRCSWFGIIVHAIEGLMVLALVFAVVTGAAF